MEKHTKKLNVKNILLVVIFLLLIIIAIYTLVKKYNVLNEVMMAINPIVNSDTQRVKTGIDSLKEIEDVIINNPINELKVKDTYKLEVEVLPIDVVNKNLKYESSNNDVITIDSDGNMNAIGEGTSIINIKDYKEKIIKSFEIKVIKIPVEKLILDDTKVTLGKGQAYIINASVSPKEATYKDISWESSNTNVVTINDRMIKAINTGTATIKATTDNGDKTATCIITVTKTNPSNEKKYALGNYNIRTGPSTDYKVLTTINKNEEIEFLQDSKNGWKKVRNSKGVVGYTNIKSGYYSTDNPTIPKHYISNVPYINQFSSGYPTGCEAVSATMVLRYKGYNVSVKNIVDNIKCGSVKYQDEDGKWYGANPFEEFVGHPTGRLSAGNYGVFAKPIVSAMSIYAGSRVKNISGCAEKELFNNIDKGNPVIVWCVKNAGNLQNGVVWNYTNGSGTFQELIGEHCAVLIGYDDTYVYLNDPSAGQNVKQNKSKFISNWKKLYSQAIIIQ